MMREILFRGKSVEDGEWVYGQYTLYSKAKEPAIVTETPWGLKAVYIVPETLGQYIGLICGKYIGYCQEKRIFEGDILRQYENIKFVNDSITMQKVDDFVVEYSDEYAGFEPAIYRDDDSVIHIFNENYCVVIGNIHDNPELLEVENDKL